MSLDEGGTMTTRKPGRPPTGRDDVTIRVGRAAASKLRALANDKGVTVADVLADVAGNAIDRAYLSLLKKLEGKAAKAGD